MHFRLGDYECESCPHRERGKPATPAEAAAGAPQSPAEVACDPNPQRQMQQLRSTRDYRERNREPEQYDPAPGIEREKAILFAVYAGRVLLTLAVALFGSAAFEDPNWLVKDGIGLGLIAAALFLPITPIKWVVAWLSGIMGLLGLLGLFLSMLTMSVIGGLVAPSWYDFMGYTGGLIASFIAAAIEIWLASALFRDMHRMQVMRAR